MSNPQFRHPRESGDPEAEIAWMIRLRLQSMGSRLRGNDANRSPIPDPRSPLAGGAR